jgi:serine/threonine protein kinase
VISRQRFLLVTAAGRLESGWFRPPKLALYGTMTRPSAWSVSSPVTPDVDIYSLGKLIFYMFTGGVVMPREYLDDPRYSSVLQQAGLHTSSGISSESFSPAL